MYGLFFDTETTGIVDWKLPSVHPSQPKLVQLGALLYDLNTRKEVSSVNITVFPSSWEIPQDAALIHGTTTAKAKAIGINLDTAVNVFRDLLQTADIAVAHNIKFDRVVMERASAMVDIAFEREVDHPFAGKEMVCTMLKATPVVKVKARRPMHAEDYKWPKLEQCVQFFFERGIEGAHDALVDVRECANVFFELMDRGVIVLPQTAKAA